MHPFITLALAITSEIIGTISLKFAEGFSSPIPSVFVLVAYASTLYFLSATLKALPIGMVYAVWSGLGTVGAVTAGVVFWRDPFDLPRFIGIGLVIAGVVTLNLATGGGRA